MLFIGLLLGLFIIYPNIISLYWDIRFWKMKGILVQGGSIWIFRYVVFASLCWILLHMNIYRMQEDALSERLLKNIGVSALAYGIYVLVSFMVGVHVDCFTGHLLFQFFIACLSCATIGHVYWLNNEQNKKEKEIEQLRIENLQSRCDALANQINPHFFFNSLNGLAALVRTEDKSLTLEYISKLSNVFRYILQSDKRGLVSLGDELDFVASFAYLQQIRYADKLAFVVDVPNEKRILRLPVVSLLPLIENVVKHNMIDSENPLILTIFLNQENELVISNPVHEKIDKPEKSGIGLNNLQKRFELLMGKSIRVEQTAEFFTVYLPLTV